MLGVIREDLSGDDDHVRDDEKERGKTAAQACQFYSRL